MGECCRQWWLRMKPPQIYVGARGAQDLLGELWDGIESAAIHPAGVVLLAERLVPSAVVPADREVRDPKCAPRTLPTKWGRAGGHLSWGNLHSSYQPSQGHLLPFTSVCVCRIWPPASPPLPQWQPGNGEEIWTETLGGIENPSTTFPLNSVHCQLPKCWMSPVMLQSCLGHLRAAD